MAKFVSPSAAHPGRRTNTGRSNPNSLKRARLGALPLALALSFTAAAGVHGTVDRSSSTVATALPAASAPAAVAPATAVPAAAAAAPAGNTRSIGEWVNCSSGADETAAVMKAFEAAKDRAFTLVVDCPVHLHSGLAIDHSIFIDSGTSVTFTGAGKFFVDNMFHPAFVIANSSGITLTNWNVEWDGTIPINPNFGGYDFNGRFVAAPGQTQPAGAFNDLVLTPWLAANRSIVFNERQGWVKSIWIGGINPAAVFFITGDTSNVVFSGLKLYVPAGVGANQYMPMAFSVSPNWKSNQTVTGAATLTARYAAVPHQITFSGLDLDGILMGWQGSIQDSLFENITSHRYGDLMTASGGTVGGVGKWFPPPHLFYLNTHSTDPALFNNNIHFVNIVDEGIRLGTARDKGGGDSVSGYANSLKLGCADCSVDGYVSHRPDGFMDVLNSDNLTVSNVVATFDSLFINNVFPAGMRYPMTNYSHITFENVQMTDTAQTTTHGPLGNASNGANDTIVYSNFNVAMNRWGGPDMPVPTIAGPRNNVAIQFTMPGQSMRVGHLQKEAVIVTMKGLPTTVRSGESSVLTWTSHDASRCSASGAWSGGVGGSGSRVVKVDGVGNHDYVVTCSNGGTVSSTTVRVVAE